MRPYVFALVIASMVGVCIYRIWREQIRSLIVEAEGYANAGRN